MTPIFPEVSADLSQAAERPSRRTARRRVLPIIGGGLSIVVVAGAATAATGVWRPQIGDERRGTPSISTTVVPAEQLALLGVLRRPATAEDRNGEVRRVLRLVGRGYRGVRTDAVRRLAPAASGTTGAQILIPAERAHGYDDALCLYVADREGAGSTCATTETIKAGRGVLITGQPVDPTPAQMRRVRSSMRAALRKNRAARRALRRSLEPLPKDRSERRRVLQRAYVEKNLNGVTAYYPPPRFEEVNYFGIVPDGVKTVTRTASKETNTAAVQNNLFHIRVPRGAMSRGTLTWNDDTGRAIKIVPGP